MKSTDQESEDNILLVYFTRVIKKHSQSQHNAEDLHCYMQQERVCALMKGLLLKLEQGGARLKEFTHFLLANHTLHVV